MLSWPFFRALSAMPPGRWIDLRPIRPSDAPAIQRLVQELSDESRYHRFFAALRELSPAMLRYLTEVDGKDHVATAAVVREANGAERIVGVARFVRQPEDARLAEAAITVVDDMQSRGLGKRLLAALVDTARHDEIDRLIFIVKRSNTAMRRLCRSSGARAMSERDAELTFELGIPPPSPWLSPLRIAARQIEACRAILARL